MAVATEREESNPLSLLESSMDIKLKSDPRRVIREMGKVSISYFQVPLITLEGVNGLPSIFADHLSDEHEEILEMRLVKTPDERLITFTLPSRNFRHNSSVWNLRFPVGDALIAEFGIGYEKREKVTLDSEIMPVILSAIESSTPRERGVHDYKEAMLMRVKDIWTEEEIRRCMTAIDLAWDHHLGQYRKSGEPYIEHPWEIVKDLLDHSGQSADAALITATWIHDILEDSDKLSQPEIDPESGKALVRHGVWAYGMEEWLAEQVGKVAAKYATLMTRPQPDGIEFVDKAKANGQYYINLIKYPQVILLKMFDRFHNLRTLEFMPLENQKATVESTIEKYDPLFSLISTIYPEAYEYYKAEEVKAIRPVAQRVGIDYDST